jgi:hypothetical protein
LPSPSDQSQGAPTLPPAELNPLLNPILAENMGRWAEVYFTSPPEKREQAVLELLRELEAKKSGRDVAPASEPDPLPRKAPWGPPHLSSEELPPQRLENQNEGIVQCEACGRENPLSHQFCGMCGAQLKSGGSDMQRSEEPPPEENPRSQYEPPYNYTPDNTNNLSLFQSVGSRSYDDSSDWEYEPEPSRPYRIYVGLALAVVILALGYIAWRGAQASQTSQGPPPAPPAASQDAEPAAAPPKKAAEEPPTSPSAANPTADALKQPSPKEASPRRNAEEPTAPRRAQAPLPEDNVEARRTVPAGKAAKDVAQNERTPATTTSANGSEELAVAQRYLTGVSGRRRDGAEAAKWLWKSIAKHNSEATLLLADLYLKGDGVSKNCDQARVLLDSAARKGMVGAGERLRNLQAFGCQ